MSIGYFFKVPFALNGDKAAVPRPTQVDGSVSYDEGWGLDYQLDPDTEPTAKDIPRLEFNQLEYAKTFALNQWQTQAFPDFIENADNDGSPYPYAINATVRYTNGWAGSGALNYYSLIDSNTGNPTDPTKWGLVKYSNPEIAGVVKEYFGATLPTGYVWANGTTVGSAASGATGRANADTIGLYTVLWNSLSNTVLPIQNSDGSAGTRGISGAADFVANKRLPTPNRAGVAGVGKDNMGGITARNLITTAGCGIDGQTLGASGGAQNVALTGNQNGSHVHAGSTSNDGAHNHQVEGANGQGALAASGYVDLYTGGGNQTFVNAGQSNGVSTNTISAYFGTNPFSGFALALRAKSSGSAHSHTLTTDSSGLGSAHLNVQPTIICNYIIALGTA